MGIMPLTQRRISSSRLAYGCMGLGGGRNRNALTAEDIALAEAAVEAALSIGIGLFDHADVYALGKAEAVFGEALRRNPQWRQEMKIQSKCGIRNAEGAAPKRFDFSKEHILASVDGSLERLGVEYLDLLLLHRPDPLMEPDEVAEAFDRLETAGKVRHFGVSNMSERQIRFLQRSLRQPLVVNQLQLSLGHLDWIEHGVNVNQRKGIDINFQEGTLEYCRAEKIQLQAWGPLAKGLFTGRAGGGEQTEPVRQTVELVREMAEEYRTSPEAIVLGWVMRHPAAIQPIIGSTRPGRIAACKDAPRVAEAMSSGDWYRLFVSARGKLLP